MEPLVSVIIPVYNMRPYLRETMDNVLGQTYRNLEILVIDDGSNDGSEAICDEYAEKEGRISVIGVYDIIRTPGLSSIVMQDCQPRLITFTSSNEHLLHILLNEVVPINTILINAKNAREPWRAEAALKIHKKVIDSYGIADSIECFDLLDYKSVFDRIANEYVKYCYRNRIVLAPTGGKIHTIACALLKNCCSDIQMEYPTPEGYNIETYSSKEIEGIYEITFTSFREFIGNLAIKYNLNG